MIARFAAGLLLDRFNAGPQILHLPGGYPVVFGMFVVWLIYSLNDMSVSGNVVVNGAMISENRRDTSSTNVDTDFAGNVTLNYNCGNIRGLPFVSTNWVVKDGAYLEQEGAN